ncbi:maleylpyruvate isomerase family mycothiol-dependent enzyme [Ornithinimicrobium faecis]|uniref:Maleylpyruvate isomerase family mycothiol-dependent enzyme n=1 Tax=Ornithinimicrobium faecis TaxID=2934158 RepID=A0ABY4YVV7_9MICO|nr:MULTISPECIES: maleylpyruvate isomerase family mycothiol-dependent enzyme [unclassified Ornithinimicrobium]USQ80292.1 maleylpyruvate isomerase family mycothiol-dependent enzyme [Ornithinimicrobium sp. HY1793]
MDDVWPMVHAERAALLADLESLEDSQWQRDSLCAGWTVHDVAAHLVDTALTTRVGFMLGLARARFDFDRQNDRGVERHRGATPRQTLTRLREVATRTSTPPGSLDSRIVEEVVHGEDIRRPLGLVRAYPAAAVDRALLYQTRTSAAMGGAKDRVAGLRLEATDHDLLHGDGALVRGTALDLLLAVSGRQSALADLTGPGVSRLAQTPA